MQPFNPPQSNIRRRTGRQAQGQTQGINFIIDQAKSKGLRQELGPDSVVTGGTDALTGSKSITPESVQFRKYTVDEIRAMGTAEAFKANRDFLIDKIDKDPKKFQSSFAKATVNVPFLTKGHGKGNIMGLPTTMGDEDAINLNRALTDMSDRLLRLRSGAQINQQEYDRLTGLFPSFKDLTVPVDEETGTITFPTIRRSLDTLSGELQTMKQRAVQGGFYNPEDWGDIEQTGMASGQPQQNSIGAIIPGQQAQNNDPLKQAIKQRLKAKLGG